MRDPYAILGLARAAPAEDIKSAYRRLAKRYHPDHNPDDPQAADLFQNIQNAYAFLKDPALRQRYDRGEIDANGAPRAQPFPRRHKPQAPKRETAEVPFPQPPPPRTSSAPKSAKPAPAAEEDGEEAMFSELFASLRRARRTEAEPVEPPDSATAGPPVTLTISFEESILGTRKPLALPSGKKIMVTVPPGVEDGQVIRLRNVEGARGSADILVAVSVAQHPRFSRAGRDIQCEVAVSLPEAVLGGKVRIPTLQGEVLVAIPEGSNTGTVLKLRGRGVASGTLEAAGDQLVTLKIVLPEKPDAALIAFVRDWSQQRTYQVRR